MTPNQKPAACAWPGCELRPSGPFCGRDRKRVLALGFSARRAEMPDEETLRRLPEMWQQHVAQSDARAPAPVVEAPAVEPGAADHPMRVTGPEVAANWAVRDMLGDHPDRELRDLSEILDGEGFPIPLCDRSPNCVSLHLRIRLHTLLDERNNLRKEREDIAAALGPKFMPADSSVANAVQNLHRYVRTVEEEGGHYALLCQQAHDELDRAGARSINNMGAGTPAERIRLLVADHTASRPTDMVQTQPKHHPWLDEVTAGSLVLTPRDVKIAKLSIDALADDNDMTDITFIADVLRVVLHLDDVPRG